MGDYYKNGFSEIIDLLIVLFLFEIFVNGDGLNGIFGSND
jgi:hypothetical protein